MEDDLFNKSADFLFRLYGPREDMSVSKSQPGKKTPEAFDKDFLAEIQHAALKIAETRRAEVERQIAELDSRIAEARRVGDIFTITRLERERNDLKNKLPLD